MEEKMEKDPAGRGEDSREGQDQVKGGFFSSLIDIFLDPSKVFSRIDSGLKWWKAFIVLAAINAAIAWFSLPLQIHLARLNENGFAEERVQTTIDGMQRMGWTGMIIAPIGILIVLFVIAGLVNMIVNLVSARSDFKKILSLVCFTGLIGTLEQIIAAIIIHARGIEEIESRAESTVSIGPLALMPEAGGFVAALMQSLSVFQIWYYIVFTLGVAAIFRISWKKALVPAATLWILGVLAALLTQKLSGMS